MGTESKSIRGGGTRVAALGTVLTTSFASELGVSGEQGSACIPTSRDTCGFVADPGGLMNLSDDFAKFGEIADSNEIPRVIEGGVGGTRGEAEVEGE